MSTPAFSRRLLTECSERTIGRVNERIDDLA